MEILNIGKLQLYRLLELNYLIQFGRYPNATTFAKVYGVSERTVRRDIEFLRSFLGAPLTYDVSKGGYFMAGPWKTPWLMLRIGFWQYRDVRDTLPVGDPGREVLDEAMGHLQALCPESDLAQDPFTPYESQVPGHLLDSLRCALSDESQDEPREATASTHSWDEGDPEPEPGMED